MKTLKRKELPEPLKELRAHPVDEDYRSPSSGGCWICCRGNGWEDTDEFEFSLEFDAFYHVSCAEEMEVADSTDPLLELEQRINNGEYE